MASLLLGSLALARAAAAQPADPYGPDTPPAKPAPAKPPVAPTPAPVAPTPTPTPAPAPSAGVPAPAPVTPPDPVLAEQVALSLVHRAQELYDARVFVDAKQLAVEALSKSPRGAAAEQAKFLITAINRELGIVEDQPPAPKPDDKVDTTPIKDPTDNPLETSPEAPGRASRLNSGVHSALYVGLLGATVGAFIKDDSPASGAVPVGIATGLVAGAYLPRLLDKLHWSDGQIRTVGAGTVWGGMIGGLFADAVKLEGTKATHVLLGGSIGATAFGAGAVALALDNRFTTGDVALIDTFAGIGAVGGFTVGMLMQPVETEAYSVNSIVGIAGGVLIGMIAAPQTNTTPRRMLRVAGLSAAGGALPFLLYAGIRDHDTVADERVTGLLSSAGLIAGAWLGFHLTADMDVGLDVMPRKKRVEDAPVALVGRHSDGRWTVGTPAVLPLSPQLAPQHGMAFQLLGAAF